MTLNEKGKYDVKGTSRWLSSMPSVRMSRNKQLVYQRKRNNIGNRPTVFCLTQYVGHQ